MEILVFIRRLYIILRANEILAQYLKIVLSFCAYELLSNPVCLPVYVCIYV